MLNVYDVIDKKNQCYTISFGSKAQERRIRKPCDFEKKVIQLLIELKKSIQKDLGELSKN